jgi:TorA maturation chaperone TorD
MDRIDENLYRTTLWAFLAEAFRRPENAPSSLAAELAPAASALDLEAAPALAVLAKEGASIEAHDDLFGHTVRARCPAYEAEYGEPKGHRYAHEISDVHGFYQAFGLRPARRAGERADHIAVECEFMAFLALKEACAEENDGAEKSSLCREAAKKFLHEHLGRFGRSFARRVRKRSGDPWFHAAADLLDKIIVLDAARFGIEAGPQDLPLRQDAGTPDDACVGCHASPGTPR